jgi:uncharacterized membrane protein (DUF441 family)
MLILNIFALILLFSRQFYFSTTVAASIILMQAQVRCLKMFPFLRTMGLKLKLIILHIGSK